MTPARLRLLMNVWPPFLASGIRVREISADWKCVRVELRARFWNRNYVGTHFGGSLFAMTDPFFMLMYLELLGRDYVVWDYGAEIRFVRPARGTVSAQFNLDQTDLDRVAQATVGGDKFLREHRIEVLDGDGSEVARVVRTLYFKRKSGG